LVFSANVTYSGAVPRGYASTEWYVVESIGTKGKGDMEKATFMGNCSLDEGYLFPICIALSDCTWNPLYCVDVGNRYKSAGGTAYAYGDLFSDAGSRSVHG